MTQAIHDLISETNSELTSNAIEMFFAMYGGSELQLFENSDLFDFRNVLTCYSTIAHLEAKHPDVYATVYSSPYSFAQALQDAPAPSLEVTSPIIGQAIAFLDRAQVGLPISEYLISRISQILSTRV